MENLRDADFAAELISALTDLQAALEHCADVLAHLDETLEVSAALPRCPRCGGPIEEVKPGMQWCALCGWVAEAAEDDDLAWLIEALDQLSSEANNAAQNSEGQYADYANGIAYAMQFIQDAMDGRGENAPADDDFEAFADAHRALAQDLADAEYDQWYAGAF